jgi:hypothetical protein
MIRSILKKAFVTSLALILIVSAAGMYLEPSVSSAAVATDSVIVTLNVVSGITITSPADTPMSTSLGVSTNTAIATTTWNVKTNNNLGYTLVVTSSTFPAMKASPTQFVNDFPSTSTPALWSTLGTGGWFGYSGYGTDVSTGTWGTGSSCGATSTPSGTLKYAGFSSTTANAIATRSATTTTAGVDTTICYAVEQKSVYIDSGTYTATITATATTL